MKLWSVILSFYILLLTNFPCGAFEDCKSAVEVSKNTPSESSDFDKECSPFFSCSTCSGFIFTVSFSLLPPFPVVETRVIFLHYDQHILFKHSNSIWQPPKVIS
ncbi:MAG TPA: DUF6660 family protein [Flavobacterium sp.]